MNNMIHYLSLFLLLLLTGMSYGYTEKHPATSILDCKSDEMLRIVKSGNIDGFIISSDALINITMNIDDVDIKLNGVLEYSQSFNIILCEYHDIVIEIICADPARNTAVIDFYITSDQCILFRLFLILFIVIASIVVIYLLVATIKCYCEYNFPEKYNIDFPSETTGLIISENK